MAYAQNTVVAVEKSQAEIQKILNRYGATHFAMMVAPNAAKIEFLASNRRVRFTVKLPTRDKFYNVAAFDKACRQKWRALCLVIKAKLESVDSKITCFEDEFLAHIVLPNEQTVGEMIRPGIAEAYEQKRIPTGFLQIEGPA